MKQSHKDAISRGLRKYWLERHKKEAREGYFLSPYDVEFKGLKLVWSTINDMLNAPPRQPPVFEPPPCGKWISAQPLIGRVQKDDE